MNATVTAHELQQLIASGSVCLIDVLLPEDFACRRIAGAGNACVYEMVFLERIAECVPDPERAVVVYDDSGKTQAASTAKEKLERAGYRNVAILEGGLQGWLAAGFAVEQCAPAPPQPVFRDGVYPLDTEKSVVEWTGRNINNRHYGRIAFSGGEVVLANGLADVGARFMLDMNTITNLDLQDEGWRSMLHRHLRSEDFFDVERYPTVTFELGGVRSDCRGHAWYTQCGDRRKTDGQGHDPSTLLSGHGCSASGRHAQGPGRHRSRPDALGRLLRFGPAVRAARHAPGQRSDQYRAVHRHTTISINDRRSKPCARF